jgi:hypothetical protein
MLRREPTVEEEEQQRILDWFVDQQFFGVIYHEFEVSIRTIEKRETKNTGPTGETHNPKRTAGISSNQCPKKSCFMLSGQVRDVLNLALSKYRPGQSEPILIGDESCSNPH